MPPLPTPIPANLSTTLSSLRAPIFQTIHNPTNARLGNKYLKKALVGPSMLRYYPTPLPPLRKLNALTPSSPYANWQGRPTREIDEELGRLVTLKDGSRVGRKWVSKTLSTEEWLPEGFTAPKMDGQSGWLVDKREERRLQKVEKKKRLGKGAPKKGTWDTEAR